MQNLLDTSLGRGRSVVRVAADVSFRREEQTEERFDPQGIATRSFQVEEERDATQTAGAAGVPGAVSNLPGGAPPETETNTQGLTRRNETRNYEVSKVTRRHIEPVGRLERLNVAVIVDGHWTGEGDDRTFEARSDEELDQLRSIVASAAGIDTERGDQVTVECVPFAEEEVIPIEVDPVALIERWAPIALGALVAIIVLLFLLFRWRRKKKQRKEEVERQEKLIKLEGRSPGQLPSGEDDTASSLPELSLDDLPNEEQADIRLLAHELAEADPGLAARVLRVWLRESAEAQAEEASEDGAVQEAA